MSLLGRFKPLTAEEKDRIRQAIITKCVLAGDCWLYRGTVNNSGYGMMYIGGKMRAVSRFMLCYSTRESLTIQADACHFTDRCPYRACCNPRHLYWGSHAENAVLREQDARASFASHLLELPHLQSQPMLGYERHTGVPVDVHSYQCAGRTKPQAQPTDNAIGVDWTIVSKDAGKGVDVHYHEC